MDWKLVQDPRGFRPFFMLAAGMATLFVPLWILVFEGRFLPSRYLGPLGWHRHEMLFGYTTAVIAGFLLTAVESWTGRATARGWRLAALAELWLLGRVALLLADHLPGPLVAAVDLAFLPALALALVGPLRADGRLHNAVFLPLLGGLAAGNLAIHAEALGLAEGLAARAATVTLDLVVLIIVLLGCRVLPYFTRKALELDALPAVPGCKAAAAAGVVGLVVADLAGAQGAWVTAPALVGGLGLSACLARWLHPGVLGRPLLWVLHLGLGWTAVGLLVRALAGASASVPATLATHVITVGGIGTLTLGMMCRVTLGHTARPLRAPAGATAAFVAISLAAAVRALTPVVAPGHYILGLQVSGALWSLAFTLFLLRFSAALTGTRLDGRPG